MFIAQPPKPVTKVSVSAEGVVDLEPRHFSLLLQLNGAMAVAHLFLCIVTLSVGNLNLSVPVYDAKWVVVATNTSVQFKVDVHPFPVRLYLTAITATFFGITAVFHALPVLVTPWRDFYRWSMKRAQWFARWLEYSITTQLMLVLLAYPCGLTEIHAIAGAAWLMACCMFSGYLTELINEPASSQKWRTPPAYQKYEWVWSLLRYAPQAAGALAYFASWTLVLAPAVPLLFNERTPEFVPVIVVVEIVLFTSFWLVQIVVLQNEPRYFWRGEVAYIVLSLVSKATLGGLVLAYLLQADNIEEAFA